MSERDKSTTEYQRTTVCSEQCQSEEMVNNTITEWQGTLEEYCKNTPDIQDNVNGK